MNNMIDKEKEKKLLEEILPNDWGTIGPHFVRSMDALAKHCGVSYGLSVYSSDAALETILRGFGIGYGDEVVIADYSDPADTFMTINVGATPVYCDICADTLTPDCQHVASAVTERTRAVIVDLPAGNPCDAKALSEYCKEKGIYFILNMGDMPGTTQNGIPIAKYADAAFLDMSEKSALGIGLAGAVVTDKKDYQDLFYAYHNCGRSFGVGATISFDEILGGDFRIDEFQASLIPGRLSLAEELLTRRKAEREKIMKICGERFEAVSVVNGGVSSYSGTLLRFCEKKSEGYTFKQAVESLAAAGLRPIPRYQVMHDQPFLSDPYLIQITGGMRVYEEKEFPNSVQAGQTIVYTASDVVFA